MEIRSEFKGETCVDITARSPQLIIAMLTEMFGPPSRNKRVAKWRVGWDGIGYNTFRIYVYDKSMLVWASLMVT